LLSLDQLLIRADPFDSPALFEDLSLQIDRGEAVGLIGPSGCGKSTLLNTVAGLIDPFGGAVTLDAKTPGELGWPAFRRRVCLVPQRPTVWDTSVATNLERPFAFHAVDKAFNADEAQKMLGSVGLGNIMGTRAPILSEGERQRVCLVRALLIQPDFLLLDEPTSALDVESAACVESLLKSAMSERGMGVLLTTHDREYAKRFCTRVIDLAGYMPSGRAVADA
jgi:ABC-type multidrug transport system ATPase subunit